MWPWFYLSPLMSAYTPVPSFINNVKLRFSSNLEFFLKITISSDLIGQKLKRETWGKSSFDNNWQWVIYFKKVIGKKSNFFILTYLNNHDYPKTTIIIHSSLGLHNSIFSCYFGRLDSLDLYCYHDFPTLSVTYDLLNS